MYTICWTICLRDGSSLCKWERCESRREVAALIIREKLEDDADVLIFGPESEESLIAMEDIFAGL